MFALQELLDLVKMSGCSLIVWLKDKVVLQVTSCIATTVLVATCIVLYFMYSCVTSIAGTSYMAA